MAFKEALDDLERLNERIPGTTEQLKEQERVWRSIASNAKGASDAIVGGEFGPGGIRQARPGAVVGDSGNPLLAGARGDDSILASMEAGVVRGVLEGIIAAMSGRSTGIFADEPGERQKHPLAGLHAGSSIGINFIFVDPASKRRND